jgi:hypothetical protein
VRLCVVEVEFYSPGPAVDRPRWPTFTGFDFAVGLIRHSGSGEKPARMGDSRILR